MRLRIEGASALAEALEAGPRVRAVLVAPDASEGTRAVVARAAGAGARVTESTAGEMWRLTTGGAAVDLLAVAGDDPDAPLDEVARRDGPLWLLAGVKFPGNAGYAIRTAEVSGAAGIVLDGDLGPKERARALRNAMGAQRFFPVLWDASAAALAAARAAGRSVIAVEDVGDRTPWQADLRGPVLFVVGGEHHGVPAEVLDAADVVLRLPMAGVIPSHNLQAAMAMVIGEWTRQRELSSARSGHAPG